ncbi:unnamed protein product [Leuciscus chuanchicus]
MDSRETPLSGATIRWRARREVQKWLQQIRDMHGESFASQCCSGENVVEGQPGCRERVAETVLENMQGDMEEREETGNEQMIEEYIGEEDTSHEQSFRMDLPGSEEESYSDQDSDEIDQTCNLGDFLSAWQGMKQSLTCDTSELDSDDENEEVGRGKRTPKPMHHYGDTEDSDREPAPKKAPTPSIQHRPSSGPSLTSRCNQPAPGPSYFAQPPLPPPPGPSSCSPPPPLTPPVPSSFCPPPPRSPSRPPSLSIPPRQLFQSPYNGSSQNNYTDLSLRHPPPGMSSDGLATSYRERATEVFMPSLNMGRSGKDPIICTAADLHMLTLMETMKQQINQLSMNMSVIMARMAAPEPVVEMPEEISLPLASLEEVDHFEGWLKNPGNTAKKQHLVLCLYNI